MLQEILGGDARNVGTQGNRCIGLAEIWGHRATAVLGLQKYGAQGNRFIGLTEMWGHRATAVLGLRKCGGTGQPLYWAYRNVGAQGNRCIRLTATIAILTLIFIRYCAKWSARCCGTLRSIFVLLKVVSGLWIISCTSRFNIQLHQSLTFTYYVPVNSVNSQTACVEFVITQVYGDGKSSVSVLSWRGAWTLLTVGPIPNRSLRVLTLKFRSRFDLHDAPQYRCFCNRITSM